MKNSKQANTQVRRPSLSLRILGLLLAIAAVLAAGYGIFAAIAGPRGFFLRRTVVMTSRHFEIDGGMLSYYYYDLYHTCLAEEGDALTAAGLDPTKPLKEQRRAEDGQSWYDYFMTDTLDYVRRILVFAEVARAAGDGFEAADSATADTLAYLSTEAAAEGMSLASYITARYGEGVSEEDVRRAVRLSAYALGRFDLLTATVYSEAELEAAYQKDPASYKKIDYILYRIEAEVSDTASEEDMREAYLKAESEANHLASAASEAEFAARLEELLHEKYQNRKSYEIRHMISDCYRYEESPVDGPGLLRWLSDSRRETGETAVHGENGDYTVVYFLGKHERLNYQKVSMRHILLPYGNYQMTVDAETAAKRILEEFLAGEATEEAFADLVLRHTADSATLQNGGLYTDIGYGSLEKGLCDWLLDSTRKAKDTAVLQSAYGYHVVLFIGRNPLPVWQEEATLALQEEAYEAYTEAADLRLYNSRLDCLPTVTASANS